MKIEGCLGLAASLCSMASFVPQVLKVWRDQDSRGVSRRMYVLTASGFALWIGYGVVRGDAPIILHTRTSTRSGWLRKARGLALAP